MSSYSRYLLLCVFSCLLLGGTAPADEGMWTFDNPPNKLLHARYGFTPTPQWLDHVRLSSVRLNDGGSGSFVSPHGLLLTNHHVAIGQLQKNSTAGHDYVRDGFYAATADQEMKSPDLEVNVLVSMEDVTPRVQHAVKDITDAQKALAARKDVIAQITRESEQKTGLRSDVVTLYQGGEYWLYRYKKYTDVRIVFAPEQQIAYFGGDPDNFTYPRYDLDMALFRVYENGKPLESANFLKWNAKGAANGELVFVPGHPGTTFSFGYHGADSAGTRRPDPAAPGMAQEPTGDDASLRRQGTRAGAPGGSAEFEPGEFRESLSRHVPGPARQACDRQEAGARG